ncbi:MAG TPA: cupredoxin domain-containing protein [Longimicrobiales bacterium]|nr:cupredoxin domain-containing protein [Longimicrobiales bacterium]
MNRIATASGLLVLALGACGTPDDEGALDTEEPLAEQPAAPAPDTAAAASSVQVTLSEWAVTPSRDELRAGPVTFQVSNTGQHPHILEVEGQGMEVETDTIPPGGRTTLLADLEPGEYELYCPIESEDGSHEQLGMRSRIVVR